MKLLKLIPMLLLACTVFVSCGDSSEKKEDDKKETVEMKQTGADEANDAEKAPEGESNAGSADSDAAIAKAMKDFLKDAAAGQVPVPEIIDAEATWLEKIGKLSNDEGVAKKFAELGDSPEEILTKIKEMAGVSE